MNNSLKIDPNFRICHQITKQQQQLQQQPKTITLAIKLKYRLIWIKTHFKHFYFYYDLFLMTQLASMHFCFYSIGFIYKSINDSVTKIQSIFALNSLNSYN